METLWGKIPTKLISLAQVLDLNSGAVFILDFYHCVNSEGGCNKQPLGRSDRQKYPCRGNTFTFRFSLQLPCLLFKVLKSFLSWHSNVQGPLTCRVCYFRNYRETRIPPGVGRQGMQGNKNYRKPLCVNFSMSKYRGHPLIVTNGAIFWGATNVTYNELQELHDKVSFF